MNSSYLNPIELLNLTGPQPPERPTIRKAYKRFLTELELDQKDEFTYGQSIFTRHDLDQTLEQCQSEEWLVAYHYASQFPHLSKFLQTGQYDKGVTTMAVVNPRFAPLLRPYFAPAFSAALVKVMKAGHYADARRLLNLADTPQLALSERQLYEPLHELLTTRTERYLDLLWRSVRARSTWTSDGKHIKSLARVYYNNFPPEIMSRLPPYFSSLYNRLAREVFEGLIELYNKHNKYALVHDLCEGLLALPHLNPFMQHELQRISNQAADATWGRSRKHDVPGQESSVNWMQVVYLVLFVIIFLFRVAACNR